MSSDETTQRLNVRVELLAQNVERHDKHLETLHETCDTLKELNTTMSAMLKNHDSELRSSAKLVESRRKDREMEVKELHTRITHGEKELIERVEKKIKEGGVDDNLLERIRKLENWKWLLMGAGIVIGFVGTKLPNLFQVLLNPPLP